MTAALEPLIRNVSDTARWVAAYRARETERPNALFRDPFARRLAGERGERIAATVPLATPGDWPLIARTLLFARLAGSAKKVVVVSEGLLIYLTAEQVGSLGSDLAAVRAPGGTAILRTVRLAPGGRPLVHERGRPRRPPPLVDAAVRAVSRGYRSPGYETVVGDLSAGTIGVSAA